MLPSKNCYRKRTALLRKFLRTMIASKNSRTLMTNSFNSTPSHSHSNFLSFDHEKMKKLVDLISQMPPEDASHTRGHKYQPPLFTAIDFPSSQVRSSTVRSTVFWISSLMLLSTRTKRKVHPLLLKMNMKIRRRKNMKRKSRLIRKKSKKN